MDFVAGLIGLFPFFETSGKLNATAPVLGSNLKPTIFAALNVLYFLGLSGGLAKARGTFARTFGEKVH